MNKESFFSNHQPTRVHGWRRRLQTRWWAAVAIGILSLRSVAGAEELKPAPVAERDLGKLDLEELGKIKVTTVSRSEATVLESPAAVYVITQDDIRRSGVTSIPEALRLAPGVNVARIDAHRWAIGVRGFNQEFSNKLLVMMDGRAVYSPLFSGVRWDQQDTALEDIERIEVVRGPTAALWGANAANGVINIITKNAKDTQGTLISGGWGTEEQGFGTVRYGGKLADDVFYRVYAKGQSQGDTKFPNGTTSQDSWEQVRGGFRVDGERAGEHRFTVQGDLGAGEPRELFVPFGTTNIVPDTIKHVTANLLGRWTRILGADSDFTVQTYFDHTERRVFNQRERLETFDVDIQHRVPLGERHALTWGGGYRLTLDDVVFTAPLSFDARHRNIHLGRLFVRDDITLFPERLTLTLGSQFEYYSFSGADYQPTARLKWTPTDRQTVWTSVSRALRTPSRADEDLRITTSTGKTTFAPNRNLDPEEVLSYELGYRAQLHERFSFDLAVFYSDYHRLRSQETIAPGVTMRDQKIHGETYGGEASVTWRPTAWWRLQGSYSHLETQLHNAVGGNDTASVLRDEGRNPKHQATVQSSWDLTRAVNFDAVLRYVDRLDSVAPFADIPAYVQLDLRLAWRPSRNLELALTGQNLLDQRHSEFLPGAFGTLGQPREIQRGVYGKVTWRF